MEHTIASSDESRVARLELEAVTKWLRKREGIRKGDKKDFLLDISHEQVEHDDVSGGSVGVEDVRGEPVLLGQRCVHVVEDVSPDLANVVNLVALANGAVSLRVGGSRGGVGVATDSSGVAEDV